MTYFSWLHLTDLHCGMREQHWLWPGVRENFFEDLEKLHKKCGPWDLVLFTGDLTRQGSAEEFQKVDELLNQLWTHFKELGSSPKLLAVPGNHDLVRLKRKTAPVRLLQQWVDQPDVQEEFWEDAKSSYRRTVVKAFKNYVAWWKKQSLRADNVNTGILPGDFSVTIEKDGAKLGIVGLNTCFLQLTDGNYEGKLALHARQFHEACKGDGPAWGKQHHACLLLTHHPPICLDPNSRQHLNEQIVAHGRFAVHLCGHMHETVYQEIAEGGTEARRIWQGRSLFGLEYFGKANEGQRLHGYAAGRIELSGNTGTLRFWPRESRLQGGQRNIIPDYSISLTDNQHTHLKKIELLQPLQLQDEMIEPEIPEIVPLPIFKNRQFELDNILNNINNPAGKHFWIVMAAPQMGKTWFLDQLSKRLWEPGKSQWVVKNVDLQEELHKEVIDSNQIISNYFEIKPDQHTEWSINAAKKIRESQRSWLLLLDSAELLEEREVAHLRQNLSQVYQHLFKSGNINYRLAFVVASHRYHQQWKGISPPPRFFVQELTPFKSNVVENALRGWIKQIEEKEHKKFPGFGDLWYRTNAEKLCQVTEGLPKLLVDHMTWMKKRGFMGLEKIEDRTTVEHLIHPYVEFELLSSENLCPLTQEEKEVDFLKKIILKLSVYRLFTISHLEKIVSKNPELEKALERLGWSVEKHLWANLGRSHLIDQSLREPWKRIYPSIRRLLFRYQCASSETQMAAHVQAEKFYQDWNIPGLSEQSAVLVERLWHQAEYLRLSCASDAKDQFITFTSDLLRSVGPPDGFHSSELLDHIEKRILNPEDPDSEEFQRTIEAIEAGLFKSFQKILVQVKEDEIYASV